jgi:hypothetical protein
MKVIQQGIPKILTKWAGRCRACKSTVEATESELTGITEDVRDGGRFSWEVCPVCNTGPYGGLLLYPTKEGIQ